MRRRLRAIKNCLAITLGRLAKVRTGMGHVFFRFSGRDFFVDLDGCHDFYWVFHSMILCRIDSWMFMG